MKTTKHGQEILKILDKEKTTLSASQIHKLLPTINLVTIYRNLEKFAQTDLVKKFHFDNQETLYEKRGVPHHHAICDSCEKVIHFNLKDKSIIDKLDIPDFLIKDIDIIVRGHCKNKHKSPTSKSACQVPKGKTDHKHRSQY